MSRIGQEQVPLSIDDDLREFLTRRFVDIDIVVEQSPKFPERKQMPYKPQNGDVHYFGDPATHNYDAAIYVAGWWGYSEATWILLSIANAKVWTPILSDGTNNATHTVQLGRYSRTADLVHVDGRLTTSALGSVSGDIRIEGLPFTSNAVAPNGTMTAALATGLNLTGSESVVGAVALNSTHILLGLWRAATGTISMDESDWSDNGDLLFSANYYV